jgi:membrane protease YdiL (CAAX protease family)
MNLIRKHPIVTFFVLSYVLAWVLLPFGSFGAFAPLLSALIVIPIARGVAGLREFGLRLIRWRVRWYWYAIAILVPLGVHLVTALLTNPAAIFSSLTAGATTDFLLLFAVRLINPTDGPLGEEPGWRGFAQAGMQSRMSPMSATLVLAVLATGWHVPLFFLEDGGLAASSAVSGLVTTVAVTFWYAWLFNRTNGSVLLVVIAHSVEGSLQALGWVYMGVWLAVAVALVAFDQKTWRRPALDGAVSRWESPAPVTAG